MTLREAVVALLSSFNWNDAKWPEIVALRAALAQPEERGERDYHGCAFSGPGRGDCEHAVGLPGTPISGQHDGPDDTVDVYGRPNGWCWWCWHMRQIRLATEPEERGAEWREEGEEPTSPGWYAVQRKDGSLCLRAFGHGLWWIPLRDGWLSGLPAGFKWLGPVEPVEWDTPRSPPEVAGGHRRPLWRQAVTPRIFVFCNSGDCSPRSDWHSMLAIAEDGTCLAGHVCSSHDYAAHDMGLVEGGWKRDLYAAHYPTGFNVVWVEDPKHDPDLAAAYALNQAKRVSGGAK